MFIKTCFVKEKFFWARGSLAQLSAIAVVDESVAEWKWSSLESQRTVAFAEFEKLSWIFYN